MAVVVKSATEMYSIMDISCICVIAVGNLTPCTIVVGSLAWARPWATVPELTMDKCIQFPRNLKSVLIMLTLQIIREEEGFMVM